MRFTSFLIVAAAAIVTSALPTGTNNAVSVEARTDAPKYDSRSCAWKRGEEPVEPSGYDVEVASADSSSEMHSEMTAW